MNKDYISSNENKQIIIDFIAGMTDDFFMKELESI